jgi:hypothetical protein
MLRVIRWELQRLCAAEAIATRDADFEPQVGELIKLELNDAYWHFLPNHLLELLRELPDGAGGDAIRTAIEQKATFVWHGPAPHDARDSSPS